MTDSEFARKRLAEISRAKSSTRRLAWMLAVVALVLGMMLGVALLDYWVLLPASVRNTGFIVLFLLLAAGAFNWLRLRRLRASLKEAALDLEQQRTGSGLVVSTAAEYLSGERTPIQAYEPELVAALESKAASKLKQAEITYSRSLKIPAAALAMVFLGALGFLLAAPLALTALKRIVLPWSGETYTKVKVMPGNAEIPVGRDLTITNQFSGRSPGDPALHWQQDATSSWSKVALKKGPEGTYLHPFTQVQNPFKYRVTGNDAVSEVYEVTTYVPPEVQAFAAEIAYPAYTRVKPFTNESPNFTVLRASKLGFGITASTALAHARLRFSNAPPVQLKAGQGNQWTAEVLATTNTHYWIELSDAKGHKGGNEQPYQITVLPDHPPKVDITEPGRDIRADATNTIPLKIVAIDDFGVSEIKLVFHKLGSPEQTASVRHTNIPPRASAAGIGGRTPGGSVEVMGGVDLPLAPLALKPYELVCYRAEALDNNTLDGPGKGVSPVYFIEITDQEGGQCKSEPGEGQKVNLLAIQKQIIADTAALPRHAPTNRFNELAARQGEAADFARIYRDVLEQTGAASEAMDQMEDALRQMQRARDELTYRQSEAAMAAEEKALADLYQVLKLMPELGNMPLTPPTEQAAQQKQNQKVKVVLEAIKKQKNNPEADKELASALQMAEELRRSQAELAERPQPSDGNAESQSDAGQQQAQAEQPGSKQQDRQSPEQPGKSPGKEEQSAKEAQASEKSAAKSGQGKQGELGQPNEKNREAMEQQAQAEEALSKQAEELAKQLESMAARDARLGQVPGEKMSQAAAHMAKAARALRQGLGAQAGTEGGQGMVSMDKVIALLKRILQDSRGTSDVSAEDFPKQYEALISEYLRRLSYEK